MNALAEIEAAIEALPWAEQQTLFLSLSKKLESGPSLYDLTRDLFEEPGMIGHSGLGDLSTNKKYLRDMGRPKRKVEA